MLTPFSQLVSERPNGSAVAAFTCYDLEAAAAVLHAAEASGEGVILLMGHRTYAGRDGRLLAAALRAAIERSPVPACLQLDHCPDLQLIESALEDGFGAVLADGSTLPYEDNVELVRAAVSLAEGYGAAVEAELGRIEGDEDAETISKPGALTDPEQAREFVQTTGAGCLAVSIGNVHGAYSGVPVLDWQRLERIGRLVEGPLALHGASGLPNGDLVQAVQGGIRKVNVNTELRRAYLHATQAGIGDAIDGARLDELHRLQVQAMEAVAAGVLELCAAGSR